MKKTLAIILSVLMVVCMMPSMAFATGVSLTGATITIEGGQYTYTGKAIEPKVTAVTLQNDGGADLSKLKVSYNNNINAGDATITVEPAEGDDTYSGSVSTTFTIGKASLGNTTYDPIYVSTTETDDNIKGKIQLYFLGNKIDNSESKVFTIGNVSAHTTSGVFDIELTAADASNFTGSKTIKFTTGIDISETGKFEIKTSSQTFTYNGSKQEFTSVDVYDTTKKINLDRNSFKCTYKNNKDALNSESTNPPTLVVEGVDGYIGKLEKSFTIEQFNLGKDAGLTIENLGKVGANTHPKPKVYLHGTLLTENVDIKYDDASIAGNKIRVTISAAKGNTNFTGSKSIEFNTGIDISNTQVTLDNIYTNTDGTYPKYTYDGSAHRPSVFIKDGNKVLSNYSDYTVTYVNDVNASTSSTEASKRAKVIITGTGTYAGKIERYYTIEPKSISGLRLAVSSSMAYIPVGGYTTKYMPSFTLYDTNGTPLVLGRDYTVTSYDYTNTSSKTSVYINLTGTGNYNGTYSAYNVVLNGTSMASCRIELSQTSYKYTGYAQTPTVKVYNGSTLVPSTYYIVSYKNNKEIGTASVTVTGTNGYTGSQTVYFTITGNTINTCTVTLTPTSYKYDGLYKEPSVTVKDGYTILTRNVDYKLTYNNNRVAGTASVVITGIGKYSGSMTKEFKIEGLDQTLTTRYAKYTKYLSSSDFNLGAAANGDGTGFTYTSSDNSVATVSSSGDVEIVGTGIAIITVATKGTTKYNPASKEVKITVKPSKPAFKVSSPGRGKVKVQITKASGVTKYQIRYGRNGNYKNYYYKYSTSSYRTQSKTLTGLSSGKLYYVKVRAYKTAADGTKVYGNWTVKKIRVRW